MSWFAEDSQATSFGQLLASAAHQVVSIATLSVQTNDEELQHRQRSRFACRIGMD